MAEPAGERCDASTGRCQSLCPAGEYLLTCTKGEASRLAIPEEALQDPVVVVGRPIACTVLETGDDPARNRTAYCCRCER
jgi:hypothetical protein